MSVVVYDRAECAGRGICSLPRPSRRATLTCQELSGPVTSCHLGTRHFPGRLAVSDSLCFCALRITETELVWRLWCKQCNDTVMCFKFYRTMMGHVHRDYAKCGATWRHAPGKRAPAAA